MQRLSFIARSSCVSVTITLVGASKSYARILVDHGADVTARADNGWTPLHVASSCGSVEVARFLIEHGADSTARNNDGWTTLAAEVGNVEVIRILVGHGTQTTAGQLTRRSNLLYYRFVFCFFVELYLQFM
jgi:ankyrin repeat protein